MSGDRRTFGGLQRWAPRKRYVREPHWVLPNDWAGQRRLRGAAAPVCGHRAGVLQTVSAPSLLVKLAAGTPDPDALRMTLERE